ncbi:hypothetical protein PY254_16985 [Rhodanobacter sp. AS-Z3]|uniref:hypothetical protein n=1 Tax=Rhodanobacter sp. AS-Z3 TaxID=3031330 RepID=UPI00247A91B7|nr:hypothetical protein [Rhodanobacter sp. AS-Z3]WEN14904.1 hypothetical protein PY254_16985 [Rhodanobacter sp. AS-Z3]
MNRFSYAAVYAIFSVASFGCSGQTGGSADGHVFKNGYGDEIVITANDVTISGRHYPAKNCSTASMSCVKFGSSFAIIAPLACDQSYPYDWHTKEVHSVFMAPTPHNPYRVLMSTTYGGLVAFIYEGRRGVTQLYYDPSIRIGIKAVWQNLDSFDPARIQYSKVHGGKLFPCQSKKEG